MKKLNEKAFTLIELLVVVLIIAILAAIALPQYFITVEKSRASEPLTLLASMASAEERYYLATDSASSDFNTLDIEVPGTISGSGNIYTTTTNFKYDVSSCTGSDSFEDCNITATRVTTAGVAHGTYDYVIERDVETGIVTCCYGNSSNKGDQICSSLGYTSAAAC